LEITVETMNFSPHGGFVLYASFPHDSDKDRMISILLKHFDGMEKEFCFPNRTDLPIQVVHNALGKPQLLEGPAISFSEGGGKRWAALCSDKFDIGIDTAGADEFEGKYPLGRIFHAQEIQHALIPADGDLPKASALLWSIKEAAVKALGCAFHLVDPLQIQVIPSALQKDVWHTFTACLSGERFPMAGQCIEVRSRALEQRWLSVAMLEKRLDSHIREAS
jgi:phosphopantetheinyl transferase